MVNNPTTLKVTAQPALAGQITLAAGSNITLSQSGSTITVASSGGGGGTPGGSPGDIQYNNSGAFGGYTTVPLASGGWGITNTRTNITTTGTINNQAVASTWLNFNNSTATTITGFVAQADGTEIVISRQNASVTLKYSNLGSTAANRIITAGNVDMVIPMGSALRLRYDGNQSRWVVASGYSSASASTDGYLTATDWQTFTNKLGGTGSATYLPYWNSGAQLSYLNFGYADIPNSRIGYGTVSPAVRIHTVANSTTVSPTVSFSASLVLESLVGPGTDSLALLYGPRDDATPNGSAENPAYTGYTNNDSVSAILYAYKIIDGVKYSSSNGVNLGTINLGSNPSGIDWIWTAATNGDGTAVDGYVLVVNDATTSTNYTHDIGNALTYADNNIAETFSDYTPFGTGFQSAGQLIDYDLFGIGTSPSGVSYIGTSANFTVVETLNNGSFFWVQHTIVTGGASWTENQNSSASYSGVGDTTFYQKTSYVNGAAATQHYGILADGSGNLTRDWNVTEYNSTLGIYASSALTGGVVDPGDSNYYSITLTTNFSSSGAKRVRQINGGGYTAGRIYTLSTDYEDDLGKTYPDGTTVTPTTATETAGRFDNAGDSTNIVSQLIIRSTAASNGVERITFSQNGTDVGHYKVDELGNTIVQTKNASYFDFKSLGSTYPTVQISTSTGTIGAILGLNSAFARSSVGNGWVTIGPGSTNVTQLLLDNSTLPTTPIAGGIEYNSLNYFGSDGTTRRQFARYQGTTGGSTNVLQKANSAGYLVDSSITDNGSTQVTFSLLGLFQSGIAISSGLDITLGSTSNILMGAGSGVIKPLALNLVAKTANYTLLNTDVCVECTANTFTITLPTAVGHKRVYIIKNTGSGVITINTTSSQTIDGGASGSITLNQYQYLIVQSNNVNWLILHNPTLPVTMGGTGATTLLGAGLATVTNVSLTNQGADIAATNLATVAGLYRVSYNLQDTTADLTAGVVTLTLSYTDGAGATTTTTTQALTGLGRSVGSVYIQLASGNLTYATTHTGIFGSAKYALYLSTERLL